MKITKRIKNSLSNSQLRNAVKKAAKTSIEKRDSVVKDVHNWEELRESAHSIKCNVIEHLYDYLNQFEEKAKSNGCKVFRADDSQSAVNYILNIARGKNAKLIVKSKSMVTEEIELNSTLINNGIEVVETDLGEYIVQLANEKPSHITAPALHKSREEIGRLFADKLGIEYTSEPEKLTQVARSVLRKKFVNADIGISGGNFAIAETGTIVVVENEGNAGLSTTLPKVHIVVIGMEKIIPKLEDVAIFLNLLPKSATGQKFTSYVSFINSPNEIKNEKREIHIIILDNGRSRILKDDDFKEVLCCIRCGACLNVCPVYQRIGGHAYRSVYPGPIGCVITPLLNCSLNEDDLKLLPYISSLCGRCSDTCPVKIPLHHKLLLLRNKIVEDKKTHIIERFIFWCWFIVMNSRFLYELFSNIGRIFQNIIGSDKRIKVPYWSKERDFPLLPKKTFREIMRK